MIWVKRLINELLRLCWFSSQCNKIGEIRDIRGISLSLSLSLSLFSLLSTLSTKFFPYKADFWSLSKLNRNQKNHHLRSFKII